MPEPDTSRAPGISATPKPRQAVVQMKEYHPPLGGRDSLRLDFNENTLACSPRVIEALGRVVAGELTKYPERKWWRNSSQSICICSRNKCC